MKVDPATQPPPLCPSAQPEMAGSLLFGVVGGTVAEPRLGYLREPQPVTAELLSLADPVPPTEVFRFAAPCAGAGCRHFEGTRCRLATRIVQLLPAAVAVLPPCRLRPHCRWWQQEGKEACRRCPLIVTETAHPSERLRQAADPDSPIAGDSDHPPADLFPTR
jgi:hypothetical protein